MTIWSDEYLRSLKECEKKRQDSLCRIDSYFIEAYTALLERTAELEAFKQAITSTDSQVQPKDSALPTASSELAQIKSDLAEALRSNSQLHSRIKTAEAHIVKLREKNQSDCNSLEEASNDRLCLSQKLKDKDEELRGKTKLLEDNYNEVVSLNLQLNMSEQKVKELRAENQYLIDRWMARKVHEWELTNN